jgi:hypothetical protein
MGAGAAGGGAWYTGAGAAADMYTGPGAGDGARAGPGEEDTGREAAPPWGCRDGGREAGTGSPRLLIPTCIWLSGRWHNTYGTGCTGGRLIGILLAVPPQQSLPTEKEYA